MLNYFLKRFLGVIPTMLIVAVLVFLFVHLLPGDPARLAAGPEADSATVDLVRKDLGLDRPMHEQFVHFFTNALRGEFGISLRSKRPVSEEQIEAAVRAVVHQLRMTTERELPSRRVGEFVMAELRKLDHVGYVRYASVYRSFEDVADFREELDRLERDLPGEGQLPLLGGAEIVRIDKNKKR